MMEKIKNNSAIKYIIVFSITLLFGIYVNAVPIDARAIKEGTHTDSILNVQSKEEIQLWEKFKIIRSIGGKSINVPALAATLLYGSSASDVALSEYEEDFNPSTYRSFYNTIKNDVDNKAKDESNTTGYQKFEANSISKLIAASIVMIDSSGGLGGTYSDENYIKALMGDKLVGNLWGDDDACQENEFNLECLSSNAKRSLSYAYNAVFCGMGALLDTAGTIIEIPANGILYGNSIEQTIDQKFNRLVTMANVCNYGYIAGVDEGIRNISDSEKKAARKADYIDGIMDLTELYRYYYEDDECLNENEVDSTAANWRQCSSEWTSKSVGGGGSMCSIGCAVTSLAYIIKTSGTALTVDNFDPGVFVDKGVFAAGGNISWQASISAVAPKGHMHIKDMPISYSNAASTLKDLLANDTNGHKTFVQLYITNHYIAVDHVDGDTIYVMDPAAQESGLVTLDDALNRSGTKRSLISYNTFYFDDVDNNSSSSSSSSSSTNDDENSYKSDTYQNRLKDVSSLVDQKKGSVWNIDKKYNSEDTIKVKMETGSAVSALAAAYYLYTGKKPDGYDFYKAAYDDKVKTDTSNSMDSIANGEAKNLDESFGLTGKNLSSYTIDKVIDVLKAGGKVIAGVKDSSFGQDHFVLLDHYNTDSEQIYVFNPNEENQKNGYFSKDIIQSEIIDKVAFGLTAIYSDYVDNENDYCDTSDGDIDALIELMAQLEGGCTECTVSSTGKDGCESYKDSADQTNVGKTTGWGITQYGAGKGLSEKVGYTDFNTDISNGCVDKEYLTKMLRLEIEEDTENVKAIYENAFPGKTLKTCQYHAFVLFYHHWPANTQRFIEKLGTMDFMSYEAYKWYLENNGAHGLQGLLNRREAEYHLLNTCNYDLTKVMDANFSESYWEERIKVYKEELGSS